MRRRQAGRSGRFPRVGKFKTRVENAFQLGNAHIRPHDARPSFITNPLATALTAWASGAEPWQVGACGLIGIVSSALLVTLRSERPNEASHEGRRTAQGAENGVSGVEKGGGHRTPKRRASV